MTDYRDQLKEQAAALRKALTPPSLPSETAEFNDRLKRYGPKHGQAIDLVIILFTQASSWNEFSANPEPLRKPQSVEEYLDVVARMQKFLGRVDSPVFDYKYSGGRAMITMRAIEKLLGGDAFGDYLWGLLDKAGILNSKIISPGGTMRDAHHTDDPSILTSRLGHWFFHRNRQYEHGEYAWDNAEKHALDKGFSSQEASLIRGSQREAINHNWPLNLWFDVGVLEPDQAAFLDELKTQDNWQGYFEKLCETDGYSEPSTE